MPGIIDDSAHGSLVPPFDHFEIGNLFVIWVMRGVSDLTVEFYHGFVPSILHKTFIIFISKCSNQSVIPELPNPF